MVNRKDSSLERISDVEWVSREIEDSVLKDKEFLDLIVKLGVHNSKESLLSFKSNKGFNF